jgi:hypothetical protein
MTLLIYCTSMVETKKMLEAIFKIALCKYDGPFLVRTDDSVETPCALNKNIFNPSFLVKHHTYKLVSFN